MARPDRLGGADCADGPAVIAAACRRQHSVPHPVSRLEQGFFALLKTRYSNVQVVGAHVEPDTQPPVLAGYHRGCTRPDERVKDEAAGWAASLNHALDQGGRELRGMRCPLLAGAISARGDLGYLPDVAGVLTQLIAF